MVDPIKAPTKKERFTLQLMILIGLICMLFFLRNTLRTSAVGHPVLYWMLMTAILYNCLTVLHEWYHYLFITVPETPPMTKQYTVDIFTTFCAGEPYQMITETLIAVKAIGYPHETYLCDEANDPYLIQLCKDLGVHHITRTLKVDAKAGNINNALKQSTGELCVVLDPDHVPASNFLDPIVSHFNNPEIGFVQVVQAYKNLHDGLIAKGAAQQTFQFYGPMMMTMNRYGTVLAIGANCTFRRTALESIGGHAAGLAEDMHTAMQLHAKGWKSVYVPAVLARGLVPATLSAYYSQQLKWSRGVFELLVATYPKLYSKFTWKQKLHYFTIPLHYLSGVIILVNFLVPILSLFFNVSPINIGIDQFFFMGLPLFTAIILVRHYVQWWVMENEERGFHTVGGLLMIGTWWIYILGLVYTILRKKVPYNPTPKDGNEANNWPLNIPNICVLIISLAAIIYGLYRDLNPYNLCMAGFAAINCSIMAFNILASRQGQFRKLRSRSRNLDLVVNWVQYFKRIFWVLRRQVYTGLRTAALLITILLSCLAISVYTPLPAITLPYTSVNSFFKRTRNGRLPAMFGPKYSALTVSNIGNFNRLKGISGVNYSKAENWIKGSHPLKIDEIRRDFSEIKNTGISTVGYYGPGVYDRSIFKAASENGLDLQFGFWIPDHIDFVNDQETLADLRAKIINTIHLLKSDKIIKYWKIGNPVLNKITSTYDKREALYQQDAYLHWINELVADVKREDSSRAVFLELELTDDLPKMDQLVRTYVRNLDGYGIIRASKHVHDEKSVINIIKMPYYFVGHDSLRINTYRIGSFGAAWQDAIKGDYLMVNGLKDFNGRNKLEYYKLKHELLGTPLPNMPEIKILKQAVSTDVTSLVSYFALIKKDGSWILSDNDNTCRFEWKLMKVDEAGNPINISQSGEGNSVLITIPENPEKYRLYLYGVTGEKVTVVSTTLNTPLHGLLKTLKY